MRGTLAGWAGKAGGMGGGGAGGAGSPGRRCREGITELRARKRHRSVSQTCQAGRRWGSWVRANGSPSSVPTALRWRSSRRELRDPRPPPRSSAGWMPSHYRKRQKRFPQPHAPGAARPRTRASWGPAAGALGCPVAAAGDGPLVAALASSLAAERGAVTSRARWQKLLGLSRAYRPGRETSGVKGEPGRCQSEGLGTAGITGLALQLSSVVSGPGLGVRGGIRRSLRS